MANEEEVVAALSPAPSDHKRKFDDLEAEEPNPPLATEAIANSNLEEDSVEKAEEDAANGAVSDASIAKRPHLEDKLDDLAENGHQSEKLSDAEKETTMEQSSEKSYSQLQDAQQAVEGAVETVNGEGPSADDQQTEIIEQPAIENTDTQNADPSGEKLQEPSMEDSQRLDVSSTVQQSPPEAQITSRKMEVPNNKVGVLIGKAGDTIRYLQINSGAKIQIMRDTEADPNSTTRPVELIGNLENINKAEKLIKDVIAEADAGGSPSLVARGFSILRAAGDAEQLQIQVPNEKVGLIIGKGGETIKNIQTRSGARVQLIQNNPEEDQSKQRMVRVSGDKKQIEMALEMIKEATSQPSRSSPLASGHNQQASRTRGPPAASQWGPRGSHSAQPAGHDHRQQRRYLSQNQQYPSHSYGNYPPQQSAPRGSFNQGWEQNSPATMQGPPRGSGHDYYGRHGGQQVPGSAMGPPPSQANYNYGQSQGPDYGQPYSQTGPPKQSYGHGYESHAPVQHPYGGHGGSQQGNYSQGGYGPQDQYVKPPSYGMPTQEPAPQPYGIPRANQPVDNMPYQGPVSSVTSYGPNVPTQQPYPYASSLPAQQTYHTHGSAPVSDGYNQPPPAAAPAAGYPQQVSQPVSGYGQSGGYGYAQAGQTGGYAQVGQTGGYASYPTTQQSYVEQSAPNSAAAYGYQGQANPAYGSAATGSAYPSGQPGYAQPAPTQPGYDQSIPQSGGYGGVPGNVPIG